MRRSLQALLVCALLALPQTAFSVRLFEGNLGNDREWLHVIDAPAMVDRVYWYPEPGEPTYEIEFATDADFANVVLAAGAIEKNYFAPGLPVGSYHFRVRVMGEQDWSDPTGTLTVIADEEFPQAAILSPQPGETFAAGEVIPIEIEVSDDTVPHLARFTVDGEYAGILGLMTENQKVKPSYGEARRWIFHFECPPGVSQTFSIVVGVTDVTQKLVSPSVTVGKATGGGGAQPAKAKGRKKAK